MALLSGASYSLVRHRRKNLQVGVQSAKTSKEAARMLRAEPIPYRGRKRAPRAWWRTCLTFVRDLFRGHTSRESDGGDPDRRQLTAFVVDYVATPAPDTAEGGATHSDRHSEPLEESTPLSAVSFTSSILISGRCLNLASVVRADIPLPSPPKTTTKPLVDPPVSITTTIEQTTLDMSTWKSSFMRTVLPVS